MQQVPIADDLLDRADAARAAGRGDVAARLYDQAIIACRDRGDLSGWIRAALGAASVYVFGAEPGRLPAQLHEVLLQTQDPVDHARLAAALARCWVYAGQARRATAFASEAVETAAATARDDVLADCLDAALAAHWGPDDLDTRVRLAGRLDEVSAHVVQPEVRLQARLWALQVACETLDLPAMHRQMRGLERLGEESPRARFFAASRRLMLDLLRGRTDTAPQLIMVATDAAREAPLADGWMVIESMKGYAAVQVPDPPAIADVAGRCESFGLTEGATAVLAEATYLWTAAGRMDRAGSLLDQFDGDVLRRLPRDVNWLLTLQCVLEAALAAGRRDLVGTAAGLLTPYAGRAVFNTGAVMFHGLTDDTLARSADLLGDPHTADSLRDRALAGYRRIGASWWARRLSDSGRRPAEAPTRTVLRLHPTGDGLWLIGPADRARPVRGLRGYHHLRELLRRPGEQIGALELSADAQGRVVQADLGVIADRRAVDAYRARLRDLDDELAEAEGWADLGRLETLRAERAALIAELAATTGLAGRPRGHGSSQERARIAVTKAIAAAIDRITAVDEPTGRHLKTTVRTGAYCSYQPDAGDRPTWILR
jgi:hypothetical protein